MADDDYELEVLLQLRKEERNRAEESYADAMAAHKKLGKEVQKVERRHRKMVQRRKERCRAFDEALASKPSTVARVQRFDRYVIGLRDREEEIWSELEKLRLKRRKARQAMERAHTALMEAVRQLKAVEQHHQKWQRQRAVEQKRRQAAKMDDVAARMWRQNQ